MKNAILTRIICVLLACMLLCGAALGLAEGSADAEAAQESAELERPEVADDIVALLGDIEITSADAVGFYDYLIEYLTYYGYDLDDEDFMAEIRDTAIQGSLLQVVYAMMEAEYGLDTFTEEEEAQFAADAQTLYDNVYAQLYDEYDDGETEEEALKELVDALMVEYGYDMDILIDNYRADAAYDRLYAYLTASVTVSDEDVIAYYRNNYIEPDKELYADDPAMYVLQSMYADRPSYAPEGIRTVKHILITYEDEDAQAINALIALDERPDDYDEQYAALKQTAYEHIKPVVDEIMARIAAGEDFDALVAEYGEDPGMQSEPYKSEGYMMYEGATHLVSEFVEAGMALENIGDVTPEPVLTSYGAHIMMYSGDITPGEAELDESTAELIRSTIVSSDEQAAFDEAINAYMESLGTLYKYPEHLKSSSETALADEIDAQLDDDTLVIDGGDVLIDGDVEIVEVEE